MAVVRIVDTKGVKCNHLVCPQVHRLLMGESSPAVQLSDKTFRVALGQNKVSKASDKQLMAKLRELGAAAPQANHVSLAPVSTIQKALMNLHFRPDVVESFTPLMIMMPPPVWTNLNSEQEARSMPFNTAPPTPSTDAPLPQASFPSAPTPPPPPSPPAPSFFPTTLPPAPALLDHQRREAYGLLSIIDGPLPEHIESELHHFIMWSKNPVQLDRDIKYKACQEVTLESSKEVIMCYLGFLHKFKAIPLNHLSLSLFRVPSLVAYFISYVLARGVSRGWVARLISMIKKVCSFLNSQQPWQHQKDMEAWLTKLDQQTPLLMPKLAPMELPPAHKVFAWVDNLSHICLQSYLQDMER
jgi:hypothetical protein